MIFKRSSGILAHPTSFPSPYGIGDLGKGTTDFLDFLYESKQKLWQILPLGPTSFGDSPYQSFSTFAGNTLLISPDILMEKGYLSPSDIDYPNFSQTMVNYGDTIIYKTNLYKKAFERFEKIIKLDKNKKFDAFCKYNSFWLDDYSLFISLKEFFISLRKNTFESKEYLEYKKENKNILTESQINDYFYGAMWNTWPKNIAIHDNNAIKIWNNRLSREILYAKFLQFEFFEQWSNIKDYANKKDILIIGDIPIFVSMDSSDAWSNSHLYHLDKNGTPTAVAGVPPDYFSETGQLWGNPLYNWEVHKKTNYEWWINRIKMTLEMVDIVRIDHFRGFESYWAVPHGEPTAENGKWIKGPSTDLFNAIEKALGKLPIIAEDLGIITQPVKDLRDTYNFPGMKILQFAFDNSESNDYLPHNFSDCNNVIYTGTHDNDTSIGWYKKTNIKEQDKCRRYLNIDGTNIAWDLIRLAFSSISVFAIIPIQDAMNLDSSARMNTPGIAAGNWQFRYTENMLSEEIINGLRYITNLYNR